ncbi:MAG: HAMP domain-containing protein [Proteobacteria bacterium]|nr:HAMP domain-containing protein [Pseudomonadota bacterium]
MGLRADSLVVRIGAVFLAGAIAMQVAILVVVFWPGGGGSPMFLMAPPREAAAIAAALEAAGPDQQATIVEALNSDQLAVRLDPDPPGMPTGGSRHEGPRLKRIFGRYADALQGRPFWVQTRGGANVRERRDETVVAAGPVRLLVRLRTGQTLVIERTTPAIRRFFNRAAMVGGSALLILAGVLLVSLQQTARPIATLARGARRFANDLSTPDLPARGAREIKDLSAALNQMKHRIRSLIDDRTRVLAAIAHDMRTYLTRLRLRAEFIDDPDQQARAIADLDEMAMLLDDTLTFARDATAFGGPHRPSVDVAAEARALAEARRGMGQEVIADIGSDVSAKAACAPLALRRMLDNLVDNAVRYAAGATLRIMRHNGQVVLAVEDDGPGVPADALERLIAPFERLESSRGRQTGGAGLGLAIVKGLAESHGGTLVLENRQGGGLRAEVRLPMAVRRCAPARTQPDAARAGRRRPRPRWPRSRTAS